MRLKQPSVAPLLQAGAEAGQGREDKAEAGRGQMWI
jgi:hypothetical protein